MGKPLGFPIYFKARGGEQMLKYTLKRMLMMIPVLLGVSFVVFFLMYISPGDPAKMILGEMAEVQEVEALRESLGLNAGFWERYLQYMKDIILYGDLGISYATREPVLSEVMERFPITLRLASSGVLVALCIGVPCGIVAATKQYSIFDHVATVLSLLGNSMPAFWMGILLILIFSVSLGIFPSSGYNSVQHMVLPALTLGTSSAAVIMRMTRSSMLEVIRQDYIRTARSKGQKERVVIYYHALKNALIPVITAVGLQFGMLLGGSILTETIFSIPGIGKLMVDSIKNRNYPVVQGGVLILAVIFSFVNLGMDLLYAYVDPRIKSQYKGTKGRMRKIKETQENEKRDGV